MLSIIRGGDALERFPAIFKQVQKEIRTRLIFLEADDATIVRRFSETRRPHPLKGAERSVSSSVKEERQLIEPIRRLADVVINTSRFNVHELREFIGERFGATRDESGVLIYVTSFGFRHGVPTDSDLVFDVRFLPNPNYIPRVQEPDRKKPEGSRVCPVCFRRRRNSWRRSPIS